MIRIYVFVGFWLKKDELNLFWIYIVYVKYFINKFKINFYFNMYFCRLRVWRGYSIILLLELSNDWFLGFGVININYKIGLN